MKLVGHIRANWELILMSGGLWDLSGLFSVLDHIISMPFYGWRHHNDFVGQRIIFFSFEFKSSGVHINNFISPLQFLQSFS